MGVTGRMLLVRADADGRIGSGHVMRCLALAQAWQDRGGKCTFVGSIESDALRRRLVDEGCGVVALPHRHPDSGDLAAMRRLVAEQQQMDSGWVVLDGYHFDAAYQQAVRGSGRPLLVVDDCGHLPHYQADILLNQNAHAGEIAYDATAETVRLMGLRYLLLRQEFFSGNRGGGDVVGRARRLLVTLGGADACNVTAKVIDALLHLKVPDLEARIVVGALNPHRRELEEHLRKASFEGELLTSVDDMASLMRWADLAISGAGSTCWELAAMGVPCVVTVLADNQERLASSLAAAGACVNLGWYHQWQAGEGAELLAELLEDAERRQALRGQGLRLVDGRGAERVVRAMELAEFSLRHATDDDCQVVFSWANDPEVRAASFSAGSIGWDEHCRWFAERLRDEHHLFYVATTAEGEPIGQVRFAVDGTEARISVCLGQRSRGYGIGSRLIRRAVLQAGKETPLCRVVALIRPENMASRHCFARASFRRMADVDYNGTAAVSMEFVFEEEGAAA